MRSNSDNRQRGREREMVIRVAELLLLLPGKQVPPEASLPRATLTRFAKIADSHINKQQLQENFRCFSALAQLYQPRLSCLASTICPLTSHTSRAVSARLKHFSFWVKRLWSVIKRFQTNCQSPGNVWFSYQDLKQVFCICAAKIDQLFLVQVESLSSLLCCVINCMSNRDKNNRLNHLLDIKNNSEQH